MKENKEHRYLILDENNWRVVSEEEFAKLISVIIIRTVIVLLKDDLYYITNTNDKSVKIFNYFGGITLDSFNELKKEKRGVYDKESYKLNLYRIVGEK